MSDRAVNDAMTRALFGKLPAKRDFISVDTPPWLLRPWETWLHGALAASRERLAGEWQAIYLKAPLWRFWIGEEIFGRTVLGSLMPSMDGIGRYYPLTLFALPREDRRFSSPMTSGNEAWFEAAETFLLGVLDHESDYELTLELLAGLPDPADEEPVAVPAGLVDAFGGLAATSGPTDDIGAILRSVDEEDSRRRASQTTVWWTVGGEGFPPGVLLSKGLPDAFAMAGLLSGRFA